MTEKESLYERLLYMSGLKRRKEIKPILAWEEIKYPVVEVFDWQDRRICRKCGCPHLGGNTPIRNYDHTFNVVVKYCVNCKFIWNEKCKDGSEPTKEYKWMGPENKSVEPNPLERFMIKVRDIAGDKAVIYQREDFENPGMEYTLEWEFRNRRLAARKHFSRCELDMIMENRSSLEGFFNIFFPELEKIIKKTQSDVILKEHNNVANSEYEN